MVKQATFNPLIKVLSCAFRRRTAHFAQLIELNLPVLTPERLGVRDMADTYIKEFITGKSTQTGMCVVVLMRRVSFLLTHIAAP